MGEKYIEIFNGEIENQSPELYDRVLSFIKKAHDLVDKGYDLPLAFDEEVPEVVQFYEDLHNEIKNVASYCGVDVEQVRTIGDVIDDYARVISILSCPERDGAEERLNMIFGKMR